MAKGGDLTEFIKKNREHINADNYSEVDGLVFAQLSYMRYEDLEWSDGAVSVSDFADEILQNDKKNILSKDDTAFLNALKNNPRYKKCTITDMAALNGRDYWHNGKEVKQSEDGQWAALTIKIGEDTSVVAMRGTNGTQLGWDEDFELAYTKRGTTAQIMSQGYIENMTSGNIYLAGHSKAGNNIVSAYVMSDIATRDRVKRIDVYDGPANNEDFRANYAEGYMDLENKLKNHYPEGATIGMLLGDNPGTRDFCRTDTKGHRMEGNIMGQHDPYSWKINENLNSFDYVDQMELSKNIKYLLEGIVEEYDGKGRHRFAKLLTQLGVSSFLDESYGGLHKAITALSGIHQLSTNPVDLLFTCGFLWNSIIECKKDTLQVGIESMRKCGEDILSLKIRPVNIGENSEVLRNYKECYVKFQDTMKAYASLLISDSEKFLSAIEALVQQDQAMLK